MPWCFRKWNGEQENLFAGRKVDDLSDDSVPGQGASLVEPLGKGGISAPEMAELPEMLPCSVANRQAT